MLNALLRLRSTTLRNYNRELLIIVLTNQYGLVLIAIVLFMTASFILIKFTVVKPVWERIMG